MGIINRFVSCLSCSAIAFFSIFFSAHAQSTDSDESGLRRSPVSYHMSFDRGEFFQEDFIERSGRKSIEERKIDFPAGKFGKGIRMSFIPDPPDADNMTGIDLDLVTAVMFNTRPGNTMGYNQPFIWGSGRINPRLGAVALWARGEPPYAVPLFEQTSIAFGRKERDLIGLHIDEDNTLGAYLRDARYVRHELDTDVQWDPDRWNHIVLNWDWANGLELWLNGEKIASSWGEDGWFETAPPGLFHLPAPGLMYDELYLMDRPVSGSEIKALMASNNPPEMESPHYKRRGFDEDRLARYSGADRSENLPSVEPGRELSLTEVWPTDVADGHIPGWYVVDGRNEMAWPHPYSLFTIIPGDADFHAEKVDLKTRPDAEVNFVTLTGNLKNVSVQAGSPEMENPEELFSVPYGDRFFYGSKITATKGSTFRIPFTETYGTPSDFQGQVKLPLSGDKRIHNVGLYNVQATSASDIEQKGERFVVSTGQINLDPRTRFAIHSVTARDERKLAIASRSPAEQQRNAVEIGAMSRLNILSKPAERENAITSVTVSLPLRTEQPEETLFLRVHDPAVPQRMWNQIAVRLKGFHKGYQQLILTLDFQDLVLTGNDRFWLDLGTIGEARIRIGDKKNPASLFMQSTDTYRAVDEYAEKELVPARAQYSKMYEWMPWKFSGRTVSIEDPYAYGGPFDILMPALAVQRVNPDEFVADFMVKVSGPDYSDGQLRNPENAELITLPNPQYAPEWALYLRDFNQKRWAMADWWADHQNPDGQLGGGWNDDTLFLRGMLDLLHDGHEKARAMNDAVHTKFELTHYYKGGYCNIYPMDRMHAGDFIGERYHTLVANLGQAYGFEREMEAAWHLGKPEQTPMNYSRGIPFQSSANAINWYWGNDLPEEPYHSKSLDTLTEEFRLYTSVFDEISFYRMTESNVHRDDYVPYGSNNLYAYTLGGPRGARFDAHVRHAVTWPSGGGPDLPRVVLQADDTSLKAVMYSFSDRLRQLQMRLDRIQAGRYRITLYADPEGDGNAGSQVWTSVRDLVRFDTVDLPVPPGEPLVLEVEQIESKSRPGRLPDLAVDPWDAVEKGVKISATVHNLGDGDAQDVTVRLMDGDEILQEKVIDRIEAPTDFVARRQSVLFNNIPTPERDLQVVVDPDNEIEEILESNNQATVIPPQDCRVCEMHQ